MRKDYAIEDLAKVYYFYLRQASLREAIHVARPRRRYRGTWGRQCAFCLAPFRAKRPWARYCCDRCRALSWYYRTKEAIRRLVEWAKRRLASIPRPQGFERCDRILGLVRKGPRLEELMKDLPPPYPPPLW